VQNSVYPTVEVAPLSNAETEGTLHGPPKGLVLDAAIRSSFLDAPSWENGAFPSICLTPLLSPSILMRNAEYLHLTPRSGKLLKAS
jgi:hypothetical protein